MLTINASWTTTHGFWGGRRLHIPALSGARAHVQTAWCSTRSTNLTTGYSDLLAIVQYVAPLWPHEALHAPTLADCSSESCAGSNASGRASASLMLLMSHMRSFTPTRSDCSIVMILYPAWIRLVSVNWSDPNYMLLLSCVRMSSCISRTVLRLFCRRAPVVGNASNNIQACS